MIIHNNYTGLAVYMYYPLDKYNAIYAEYLHNAEYWQFYSNVMKRLIQSGEVYNFTRNRYQMNYTSVMITDVADYSIGITGELIGKFKKSEKVGIVVDDNMLLLAKDFLINDTIGILYFDELVKYRFAITAVKVCFIIRKIYV